MKDQGNPIQQKENKTPTNDAVNQSISQESTYQLVDNRPESVAQRKLQEMADNSPQVKQLKALQEMADNSPRVIQQKSKLGKTPPPAAEPIQRQENKTGLPNQLKAGIENLSGHSLDDVKVHYNSPKPAQLQAHAYAQGTDIHMGPGQEKHLAHEAWHVVQQKQGRVKPTLQMKAGVKINDDTGLEKEADVMGRKALQMQTTTSNQVALTAPASAHRSSTAIQRLIINTGHDSFATELRKTRGWIIASDIYVALQRGGNGQQIIELNQINNHTLVGKAEDIFLQGHGSPGNLGSESPATVSRAINYFLPADYTGQIVSLSCSAGVAGRGGKSGVDGLAEGLNKKGVRISGAAGIALNHTAYTHGRRAIPNNKYAGNVEKTINAGIAHYGIDATWDKYIKTWRGNLKQAAAYADQISKDFYVDLQVRLQNMNALVPEARQTQVVTHAPPKGPCYLTTACTQFKGLSDDCDELTTLRQFRDTFLSKLPDGESLVELYYRHAPFILAGIDQQENRKEIYEELYEVICFCVKAVKEGRNETALHTYKTVVEQLNHQYGGLYR